MGMKRAWAVLLTIGLAAGMLAVVPPASADHVTFVVNSDGDDPAADPNDGVCLTAAGECTLRAAIQSSNSHGGPNTIHFSIGSGPQTISVTGSLPAIVNETVTIDGTTQPGGPCTQQPFPPTVPCIAVDGGQASIAGFRIFTTAPDSVIRGLWIRGFTTVGINTNADNTVIEDNLIGLRPIFITGLPPSDHNGIGVRLGESAGFSSSDSTVRNNTIRGNTFDGVLGRFAGSTGNLIESNLITDNGGFGVNLHTGTSNNTVRDNTIRDNAKGVVVGTDAGDEDAVGNEITENRIFFNTSLGIDLGDDGVTPNDGVPDSDTGPNNLQNFPEITSAELTGDGFAQVGFRLDSQPNHSFRVEFFSNAACDPSGHGEGRTFLDSFSFPTDVTGVTTASITIFAPPRGQDEITATATSIHPGFPRDTSEFSACQTFEAADLAVTKTGTDTAAPGEVIDYFIEVENLGTATAEDVILEDTAPEELTGIQVVDQGTFLTCTVHDPEGTSNPDVTCDGGTDFAPGASTTVHLQATVEPDTPDGTTITNFVELFTSSPTRDDFIQDIHETLIEGDPVDEPALEVEKTADQTTVAPDDTLRYTIDITNPSTVDVEDVTLADNMDPNTTFDSFITTGPFACDVIDSSGSSDINFTCGTVTLDPGDSAQVIFDVTVDDDTPTPSEVTNAVRVFSSNVADDPACDPSAAACDAVTVQVEDEAAVGVEKTAHTSAVSPGDVLRYTINVSNAGPEVVEEVTLADNMDPNTTFVEFFFTGPFDCEVHDPSGGSDPDFTCGVFDLNPGASAQVAFDVTIDGGTPTPSQVTNEVRVFSSNVADDPACDPGVAACDTVTVLVDDEPTPDRCPGFEHLTGHIHIVGTPGNDVLLATSDAPHVICGLEGNDHIEGGDGDDILDGGPGDNFIHGRGGDDRIFGREGNDDIRGGPGNDVIRGGRGNNVIRGGPGNDHLFGGPGDDRIFGGSGNDVIRGGAGDTLIRTGPGNNIVRAGPGDDTVIGGRGNNVLIGGTGRDLIRASGNGNNILRGGPGRDRLVGAPGPSSSTRFHCGPGFDVAILRGGANFVHPSCNQVVDQT